MKNKNFIIGAALIGTAGYLYFKNVIKKKNELITDTEIKDSKMLMQQLWHSLMPLKRQLKMQDQLPIKNHSHLKLV